MKMRGFIFAESAMMSKINHLKKDWNILKKYLVFQAITGQ